MERIEVLDRREDIEIDDGVRVLAPGDLRNPVPPGEFPAQQVASLGVGSATSSVSWWYCCKGDGSWPQMMLGEDDGASSSAKLCRDPVVVRSACAGVVERSKSTNCLV